jgi:hypothetical protein
MSGRPDRMRRGAQGAKLFGILIETENAVIAIRSIVALAAAALFAVTAQAEPVTGAKSEDQPAASKPAPQSGGFKQDVKHAWSDTRAGIHRTGREIRDGVRSAGRATGDAFRSGWRKVKETFAGAPAPAKPSGAG